MLLADPMDERLEETLGPYELPDDRNIDPWGWGEGEGAMELDE